MHDIPKMKDFKECSKVKCSIYRDIVCIVNLKKFVISIFMLGVFDGT